MSCNASSWPRPRVRVTAIPVIGILLGVLSASTDAATLRLLQTPEDGITVGDAVQLVFEVQLAPGEEVSADDWTQSWLPEDFDNAEIVAAGTPSSEDAGGGTTWRQIVTLRSFRPGAVELPEPQITIVDSTHGSESLLAAEPVRWLVSSVLPEDREISLQPPVPLRNWPVGKTFWQLAGALAVLAIAGAWLAHRAGGFLTEEALRQINDPLTDLRRALKGLDPRQPDVAHAGLSVSLRQFLGRRTGMRGLEHTNAEILRDLSDLPVSDNSRLEVRELLDGCDRIKFGRFSTSLPELTERVRRTQSVAESIDSRLSAAELATVEASEQGVTVGAEA